MIASIAHRTPPRGYGPWEQVASTLTEGLVALGHEVTLFATADSITSGHLHAETPRGYEEDPGIDAKVYEGLHNAAAFERAGEFDIMSNQFDFLPLTYSRLVSTPVVTTIHGFSSQAILPVYRAYDDIGRYVANSDADRHPDLSYEATIHHGLELARFTFATGPGSYLLSLGRIHPDKGRHLAIQAARRAGLPLVIAGIVQDRAYFRDRVEPHLGRAGITYAGAVGPVERDALLGGALALLHLISFAEPFGLCRGGIGHGDACDRVPVGLHARAHPPRQNGFPRRRRPRSCRGDRAGRVPASPGLSRRCRGTLHRGAHGGGLRQSVRRHRLWWSLGCEPVEQERHIDEGEANGRVADPVGEQQLVAV